MYIDGMMLFVRGEGRLLLGQRRINIVASDISQAELIVAFLQIPFVSNMSNELAN